MLSNKIGDDDKNDKQKQVIDQIWSNKKQIINICHHSKAIKRNAHIFFSFVQINLVWTSHQSVNGNDWQMTNC